MRELLEAGEFVVLERERILEIIRELEFAESRYVDADSVKRTGKLYGVHFIIEAAYFPPAQGGAAAGEAERIWPSHPAREVRTDHSAVYLDVFDVETGQVRAVCFGSDRNPAVAARNAVDELVSKLASATPPIAVQEVGDANHILINIGAEDNVKAGDKFQVVRPTPPPENSVSVPEGPTTIEVWKVDPLTSLGRLLFGGSVSVGDHAARVERPAMGKRSSG